MLEKCAAILLQYAASVTSILANISHFTDLVTGPSIAVFGSSQLPLKSDAAQGPNYSGETDNIDTDPTNLVLLKIKVVSAF